MPTYIITNTRYTKPLPPLPHDKVRAPPHSLVSDTSSVRSHTYYTRSAKHYEYGLDSEGSISSCESLESASKYIVPSILKSSKSSIVESSLSRRRPQRKTVRFLPIIDNLLHHGLHKRCVSHDLRFSPHSARLPSTTTQKLLTSFHHGAQHLSLCERTRGQPAVSPPVKRMWIVSYEFPWTVEVNGTGRGAARRDAACYCSISSQCKAQHEDLEAFVTIFDVLHALWSNLQRPVVETEWSTLTSSKKKEIKRTGLAAYANEPCRSAVDTDSTRSGRSRRAEPARPLRRIDWLGTHTRFGGLRKDDGLVAERVSKPQMREATWGLVLEDNGFRYQDIGRGC